MGSKELKGFIGKQRDRQVITGVMKVSDLIELHEIDVWTPGKKIHEQGSQRPPIQSHYRKIGRKMKDKSTWLPTSVTLSASINSHISSANSIEIHATNVPGLINIHIPEGKKLRVIDGQHRIKGLEYAIRELKLFELEDFEIPFVLLLTASRIDEIKTFFEINSTPKKVPTDLALQLLNEMNQNDAIRLSKTEKWKLVALNVAMTLNKMENSIWYENISVGHVKSEEIASSVSFVTSLKPFLEISFVKKIWMNNDEQEAGEVIAKLVHSYWEGLKQVMPHAFPTSKDEQSKWVIQKTPGFYTWHMIAPLIIEEYMIKREKTKSITPSEIAKFIKKYADYGVQDYERFWRASNKAEGIAGGEAANSSSQKAFKELAKQISEDISESYEEQEETNIEF